MCAYLTNGYLYMCMCVIYLHTYVVLSIRCEYFIFPKQLMLNFPSLQFIKSKGCVLIAPTHSVCNLIPTTVRKV